MKAHCILLSAALALGGTATTQRTLDQVQAEFERTRDDLFRNKSGRVTFEDIKKLALGHVAVLEKFLQNEAKGDDRINGRLMLANIYIDVRENEKAKAALLAIDTRTMPALPLLTAAEMAGILGMKKERDTWVQVALAKRSPFEDRMAVGMFLMTRLVELDLGKKVFDDAMAAAKDDEQRSRVAWFQAAATREREDVADGSYDQALEALAIKYPKTYWGGVARDRLSAMSFKIGSPAVAFRGKDQAGNAIALSDFAGKVVLLDFWAAWCEPCIESMPKLIGIYDKFHKRGFAVVGVSLDDDSKALRAAIKDLRIPWRSVYDGKAWSSDVALRYAVEQVPHLILIGADGKIAGLRLWMHDDAGERDLETAIEAALKAAGN